CRLVIRELRAAPGLHGQAVRELNRRYTPPALEAIEAGVRRGELRGDPLAAGGPRPHYRGGVAPARGPPPRPAPAPPAAHARRRRQRGAAAHGRRRGRAARAPARAPRGARRLVSAVPGLGAVLIANRGEIALRIASTLRRLGIRSVVAHHRVDRGSPAVRAADAGVEIEAAEPLAAYLDAEQIAAAAARGGAHPGHPGYGFPR